tara:strand:- start:405 stop:1658 length:1254 start_codon:yes stop_codon:yes gene_type:complete
MKNNKAISLLITANIVSGFATGLTMISIPWYFKETLNQPDLFMSIFFVITFICMPWGIFAGTIVDRFKRKNVFIISALIPAFTAITASFAANDNEIHWMIVSIVFGMTVFYYNIYYPNLYAFAQEITEKKYFSKINSYLEIQGQVTSMIAGGCAAILLEGTKNKNIFFGNYKINLGIEIDKWNLNTIFLIDGITYIIAAIIISFVSYKRIQKNNTEKGKIKERIKSGFKFLNQNKNILIFGVFSYIIFAFLIVEMFTLLPEYVKSAVNGQASVFASSELFYSMGAIISGLIVSKIFKNKNTILGIIIFMFITWLICMSMAFYPSIIILFITSMLLGITNAGTRILRITYIFNHVPNNYIGRVNSIFNLFNVSIRLILISIFMNNFFTTDQNIVYAYFICGVIVIICIIPLCLYNYDS